MRVVDVRGKVLPPGSKPRYLAKRGDYDAGHVPGAVFVDWTRDIVDDGDPVPMQVAGPGPFAAKMAELGIGDDTLVVAYDDYDHIFAGRLAWALRYYGHDAVRILDGGWSRWVAEGRPTTTPTHRRLAPSAVFTARPRPALRRTARGSRASCSAGADVLLIDATPAGAIRGRGDRRREGRPYPGRAQRPVRAAGRCDDRSRSCRPRELARVVPRRRR